MDTLVTATIPRFWSSCRMPHYLKMTPGNVWLRCQNMQVCEKGSEEMECILQLWRGCCRNLNYLWMNRDSSQISWTILKFLPKSGMASQISGYEVICRTKFWHMLHAEWPWWSSEPTMRFMSGGVFCNCAKILSLDVPNGVPTVLPALRGFFVPFP